MPSWLKWTLIGCGTVTLVAVVGVVGCVVWLGSGPESGVKLTNEMDPYALEYLEGHGLLEPEERVVAYYDATIAMDGTEAAILTDRRVMYHREGSTISIPIEEIIDIDHRTEGLIGDVIEVVGADGTVLRIEIAPLNDGPAFFRALKRELAANGAGEPDPADGEGVPDGALES